MEQQFESNVRLASELMGAKIHPDKKKRHHKVPDRETRGQHLKPHQWQKGQSGNPKGRPPSLLSLTSLLNKHLNEHPEDAQALVKALVALGKQSGINQLGAIDKIFDRIDGKVTETHKIEGELPIKILFVPATQLLAEKKVEIVEVKELTEGKDEGTN